MLGVLYCMFKQPIKVLSKFIMSMLLRKLNYRNIILGNEFSGEAVGILRRNGEFGYFTWLGFIERVDAIRWEGAVPVKIEIAAYSLNDDMPASWVNLDRKNGEMVHGCYVGHGVFGVTEDGVPRIVKRTCSFK